MRIACLSRITMAHDIKGGMEHHLQSVAEGLVRLGHQVEVFTTACPTGEATATLNGIPHYFLNSPAGRYRLAWARESRQAARQMAQSHGFDVLWGQGAGAEAVSRLPRHSRLPLVTILHGTFLGEFRTRMRNLHSPRSAALALLMIWRFSLWRSHIRKADRLIVLTDSEERTLRRWFRNLPPVRVIPNGIDIDLFSPNSAPRSRIRQQLNLSKDTPLLVVVGRLVREKGIHLAIAGLRDLKKQNAHLLIIGTGEYQEPLQNLADTLGVRDRVHFTGYVDRVQLSAYYNAADVFLMPTLCDEGLPLTLIEGMASGLPTVASNVSGISAAIDQDQEGILIPIGDRQALVNAVNRILDNPVLALQLARDARAKAVSQFSVERMVADTEEVFKQALDDHAE